MKKTISFIIKIVGLIIVALVGLRYVKDHSSLLDSEDVKKAKAKIKKAHQQVKNSRELRKVVNQEVQVIKAKSVQRKIETQESIKKVEDLEKSTNIIEQEKKKREELISSLLKKK